MIEPRGEPCPIALILAPTGRDASIMQDLLQEVGIDSDICRSVADIVERLGEGTLFVVAAEEGFDDTDGRALVERLAMQPPWSDLPFIALTFSGGGVERNPRAARIVEILGNVSFLERPFHPTTFVSLAKSAARARKRQYATRGHLRALQRSENAVRESEQRFRMLADNIAQFAWMADKDGLIFWYNKRWFDFTGTTLDEMRGWGWTKVHHPDHVDRVVAKIQRSWDTGEPWEDTFPLRGTDGQYRWFLSRALPIRDESDQILCWFGTNTDITEVRQTEERLRDSEATFRAMFANSSLGKMQVDAASWRLLRVNAAMSRITGYGETELLALSEPELTDVDHRAASEEALERLSLGEISEHSVEKRYYRKDGSSVWVEVTMNTIQGEGRHPIRHAAVVQDITERKRNEEQIRLLMREVNHRSKNLLTVVQSIARQTARDTDPQEFVRSFSDRLQGMSASQDLLIAGDWKAIFLEELVQSQLRLLGETMHKRVNIVGPLVVIEPQAAQGIGLALHELATNALKYGALSEEKGSVHVEWAVEDVKDARRLRITWSERGGPQVEQPSRRGFGTVVIEKIAASAVNGEVDLRYDPAGLVWTLIAKDVFETAAELSIPA